MPYSEWDDDSTPIPPSLDLMSYELAQKKPNPLDIIKAGVQHMPGAPVAQTALSMGSDMLGQIAGIPYGIYQSIKNGTYGTQEGVRQAQAEAEPVAQALHYTPPTREGREFQEAVGTALEASKLPPYIGHMPPARFNANDVRVLAKQNIERAREVGRIREDFRNAQEGVYRESPLGGETYGTQLQRVAEDIGDVTARRKAMGKTSFAGVPEGMVEVFDPKLYAVRNTGEGQMIRPQTSEGGMEPRGVDFGLTEEYLREIAPPLTEAKPQNILETYEQHYMSGDTPQGRALQSDWGRFNEKQIRSLYPNLSEREAYKAFQIGYPTNVINDLRLKWFHDFIAQEKAKGIDIPTMEEYFIRAQAANTLTKKIIPNIIQKYIGTPNDPFLESAKQGITMNPEQEIVDQYTVPRQELQETRREAGFEPEGEVGGKLLPVAESKLATQKEELHKLIAEQFEIGQTEGMVVPYPDQRIDPQTGQLAMATNPNYAQYSDKIGAMRKMIADTQEEIRKLNIARAYENLSDASIKMAPAFEWRNRIPPEEQQFHPALFGEKPLATPEAEREFKTPAEAPFFSTHVQGLTQAGILPLAKNLIGKIMSGEIPPNQVPTLAQPQTLMKYMSKIVAPRIEKEKAVRLAQENYKQNVENHFQEIVNDIPDSMKIGSNAKLLWLDDGVDTDFANQAISDETFVLDHCIGQSGSGKGMKNLFSGESRQYLPYLDPATKQKFEGASGTSSYMDRVESGDLDVMSIRDDKSGLPVGTIELNKTVDDDGNTSYSIGYVSGYKNRAIKPEYRDALRDALNKVGDNVVSSDGNENKSGVYNMYDPDQTSNLRRSLENEFPSGTPSQRNDIWKQIKKEIQDTLDGDRYITIDQAQEAVKAYKQANPPVPAVRQQAPAEQGNERNIVMQGLSRENLNTTRQLYSAQIVAHGNRFEELPVVSHNMEHRPLVAYRRILQGLQRNEQARGQPMSDYDLFRQLQTYADQIEQGQLRFADFDLGSGAELLELQTALQKHADAIGQLAHYADVLERNGYRTPLPSERTGAPEWQAYQRFMDELTLNDPNDLRTRLRDMIEHGDPREINANLDALQQANFKHLLEIHDRAIKQALDHPAPTQAPVQQRGIPLAQWTDVVSQAMDRIQNTHGENVRNRVAGILAEAIGDQMDTPVNERPVQVSNFLNNARENNNSQQVRSALQTLSNAIDQANADVQNARNAPAPAQALPTDNELRSAIQRGFDQITRDPLRNLVERLYDDVANEMVADNLPIVENPRELVNRLFQRGDYYIGEGEVESGAALRGIAREISNLLPAEAQGLPSHEDFRNALLASMNDIDATTWTDVNPVFQRIAEEIRNAGGLPHQQPRTIVNRLNEEANFYDGEGEPNTANGLRTLSNRIARLIPEAPPASMALANQNAMRHRGNLVVGQEALSNSILERMHEYGFPEAISDRLQALQWRENLNNDPVGLMRNIRIEADAEARAGNEQLASAFYDIANLIADENGQTMFTPAGQAQAPTQTPRDIAETASAPAHQTLTQRIAQVDALANGINEEIRSIPTSEAGLRQAQLFYQDPNNLPASVVDYTHQFEDAERISAYLLQHVNSRLANLNQPQTQAQMFDDALERVANELRNTYTDSYIRQFQIGDVDVRREVLRDVQDRPAVYGMARVPPNIQTQVIAHLRNEGLPENQAQLPAPNEYNPQNDFPTDEQFRDIARAHTNSLTGAMDSFYRIARDLRGRNPEERAQHLARLITGTNARAGGIEASRVEYGVDSPAGMAQLHNALLALRDDLGDRNLVNQLQAPAEGIGADIQRIIGERGRQVNRANLGTSQAYDRIVGAASAEFDPLTQPERFITSLLQRASSVQNGRNYGEQERDTIVRNLRLLANDVQAIVETAPRAPALPAPDQAGEHWNRVEQGVNQPAGLGALTRADSEMVRRIATNQIAGAQQNIGAAMPSQRDMASVLIGSGEATGNAMPAVEHTRLINTLTSETYNPATDGEALIRLLEQRAGMFANLESFQAQEGIRIVNDWNRLRFPNYRPPEEGMGLEPEGHKRGGVIRRKMNEGGEPPKLTPYEQFKIDNAERIRQGQEINESRNKYEPYKGSDKPIPTQRGSAMRPAGSAGTLPSGGGPSLLDRPRLYAIGGKVYMEVGGGVKPVPNVPQTPAKTNPNTTDHVIRRPVDEGFKEVLERVRSTPKPTGSAGTIPSGSGTTLLDRPHLYAHGGRIHMNEGGLPEFGEMTHAGIDPRGDTKVPAEYARTGLPEVTGDPYDVWETKYQLNQASKNNQNFTDPAYTLGMKEIRVSTPMDEAWGGYHTGDVPDVVHIKNIHSDPNHYSQVLTHEGQHLQDYKSDQNKMPIRGKLDAMEYLYKSGNQYLNQRAIENNYQAYKDKWLAENPEVGFPHRKLGAYWSVDAPWNERLADLNSIEAQLKRGERFADTEMGRAILNTPELQNYYYQSARPMEAKALPYEPTVFDRIRNARRNFSEKVDSGKSFADSAYETAKEFKSGGDVNIDAMRLALMKG